MQNRQSELALLDKAIITCALTGVLTDPKQYPVPVTAKEMADEAYRAYNEGASIMHCHFRSQEKGFGHLPTWDEDIVDNIVSSIRNKCPDVIINMSTGVMGSDISAPISCLRKIKPEMAALNAGSLNYLKLKSNNTWAWPPMLFDNRVEKILEFLSVMNETNTLPECECFDTGILRSVVMFESAGLLKSPAHVSLVMGVASGMPAKASWLPLLIEEMSQNMKWQVIAIGREEVWSLHQKAAELGGHLRTGLEDTFYLPNGKKANSNGDLISGLANIARLSGRTVASPKETRQILGIN